MWTLPDPDGNGDAKTFNTEKHRYPEITDIFWSPNAPSAEEMIVLGARIKCYGIGGGEASCPDSGYSWIMPGGEPSSIIGQASLQTKFLVNGIFPITLNFKDSEGYPASRTESIPIKLLLPGWKEK